VIRAKQDENESVPEPSLEHVAWLQPGGHGIQNPTSSASPYLDGVFTDSEEIQTPHPSSKFICTQDIHGK
jgi:hypothetical protein